MSQPFETLLVEPEGPILWVRLNRPEVLNAINAEMHDELEAAFDAFAAAPDEHVCMITGAGRAFCAGMDLSTGGNVFGLDETLNPSLKEAGSNVAAVSRVINWGTGLDVPAGTTTAFLVPDLQKMVDLFKFRNTTATRPTR